MFTQLHIDARAENRPLSKLHLGLPMAHHFQLSIMQRALG
jgi:hypothetical protein